MNVSRPAVLPVSLLFGGREVWTAAWSARRLDLVRDAVLTLPGEPPLRMVLGRPQAAPSVAWAWVGDDTIGIEQPGWIADGLSPGDSTPWADVVLLDRLAPVFDWIEQATRLRSEAPYVRFGVRAPVAAAHAVSLRIERGDEIAVIGLALRDEADRIALVDAFGEQGVIDRTGDDFARSDRDRDRDRTRSGFARGSTADQHGADDTPAFASEQPAIRAWLIEAHAPIDAQTLSVTRNGDGLVLDPVAGRGICRLWVAYEQSWFEIASVSPQSIGQWSMSDAGFDGTAQDACLFAVDPGPFEGSCVHVAAAIGHVDLDAARLAELKVGDRFSIALRPDRLREIVTPERALGLAELHNAGRHRIARLWSGGA